MLDSSVFASRATTAAWLRSLLVSRPDGYHRDRIVRLLGDLRRRDDGPLLRAILLDFDESASVRAAAGEVLASVGYALSADDLAPFLAGARRLAADTRGAAIASLVPLAANDSARALLDAAFRQLDPKSQVDSLLTTFNPAREWVIARLPSADDVPEELLPELFRGLRISKRGDACVDVLRRRADRLESSTLERLVDKLSGIRSLATAARDHPAIRRAAISRLALPLPELVDALGEDGLLARIRAVLIEPACARSGDHVRVRAAVTLLASCGQAGVRVAEELLEASSRQQTSPLVKLVVRARQDPLDALVARAVILLETERDVPLVEAVLKEVAQRPRELERKLLGRALSVPSLRPIAFEALAALDRSDPMWDVRALALAGDDPVLRARVHVRRTRAGDRASRDALFDLAFTGPGEARELALQALTALAPERRDLFRKTLAEPRPPCLYGCCDKLGMLSVMVLTRGATLEDVALMVEANLVGPWPLAITKALEAQWLVEVN